MGAQRRRTNESAILYGDPSKPGPYVMRLKWLPGNMSRTTFDPNGTVPAPAGSYVIHYAGKVHHDGAKVEETPATSTPAEKR